MQPRCGLVPFYLLPHSYLVSVAGEPKLDLAPETLQHWLIPGYFAEMNNYFISLTCTEKALLATCW